MIRPLARRHPARGRRRTVLAIAALAAAGLAALAAWRWLAPPPLDAGSPAVIAQGRAVYEQHCASCHGVQLEGQPGWQNRRADGRMPAPPHDASGHTWHHPNEVLRTIVRDGVQAYAPPGYQSDMPAFGGVLTDAQIRMVLAYIESTWPPGVRAKHDEIERASRQRR